MTRLNSKYKVELFITVLERFNIKFRVSKLFGFNEDDKREKRGIIIGIPSNRMYVGDYPIQILKDTSRTLRTER
jgi:hypothetical protein